MKSFFQLLCEYDQFPLAIFVYDRQAKVLVSSVLRQFNIPIAKNYHSVASIKQLSGKADTPRFIISVTRQLGQQIIQTLEIKVKETGFDHLLQAGIEIFFD